MNSDISARRRGGARPVADAPVDELLGGADELARRWAVSLVATRALGEMAGVPLAQLAREAPELCSALLRALRSDAELAQLIDPAASRSVAERSVAPWAWLAPGGDAAAAVGDVEALRSVIWTTLLDELRDPPASLVAGLADRLAFVCASLLAVVLASLTPGQAGDGRAAAQGAPLRERILYSSHTDASGGRGAVLIDEGAEMTPSAARTPPADPRRARAAEWPFAAPQGNPAATSSPRPGPPSATPRARPWDTPLATAAGSGVSGAQDSASSRRGTPAPGGEPSTVRITRGAGSSVDERV